MKWSLALVLLQVLALFGFTAARRSNQALDRERCTSSVSAVLCSSDSTYLFSDGNSIRSIDLRTGRLGWRFEEPGERLDSNIVANSSLVAVAVGNTWLQGLARTTGRPVWRVEHRSKSLGMADGMLIASVGPAEDLVGFMESGAVAWTRSGRPGAGYVGVLGVGNGLALTTVGQVRARDGQVQARWPPGVLPRVAALSEQGLIAVGAGHSVSAHSRDLRMLWRRELHSGVRLREIGEVALGSDRIVVSTVPLDAAFGEVHVFGLSFDGQVAWERRIQDVHSLSSGPLAVAGRTVLFGTAARNGTHRLMGLNIDTGEESWSAESDGTLDVSAGILCALTECYFVTVQKSGALVLLAVEPKSGAVRTVATVRNASQASNGSGGAS